MKHILITSAKLLTFLIGIYSANVAADNEEYRGFNPPPIDLIEAARLSSQSCLALNLYREGRGGSDAGLYMIMGVIFNRYDNEQYPDDYCDVIFQHKQFSWVMDMLYKEVKDVEQWRRVYKIVEYSLMNRDFVKGLSQGATHYHATSITPYWVDGNMKRVARVDKHIFYRWEGKK